MNRARQRLFLDSPAPKAQPAAVPIISAESLKVLPVRYLSLRGEQGVLPHHGGARATSANAMAIDLGTAATVFNVLTFRRLIADQKISDYQGSENSENSERVLTVRQVQDTVR